MSESPCFWWFPQPGSDRGSDVVELLHNREEHIIRLDFVPDRELPDGHPRVVHYDAIGTEALDELAYIHADGRCEDTDRSPLDPFEDQLLGASYGARAIEIMPTVRTVAVSIWNAPRGRQA